MTNKKAKSASNARIYVSMLKPFNDLKKGDIVRLHATASGFCLNNEVVPPELYERVHFTFDDFVKEPIIKSVAGIPQFDDYLDALGIRESGFDWEGFDLVFSTHFIINNGKSLRRRIGFVAMDNIVVGSFGPNNIVKFRNYLVMIDCINRMRKFEANSAVVSRSLYHDGNENFAEMLTVN